MALRYETLAKFRSKGGDVYFVKRKVSTGELFCTCKGCLPSEAKLLRSSSRAKEGLYYRHCKHVYYVKSAFFLELTDIPTYQEALKMDWGKNPEEKEKWLIAHLKEIEL